jgi:hypothetical protein
MFKKIIISILIVLIINHIPVKAETAEEWYCKGILYNLGESKFDKDRAMKCFDKALEINPAYFEVCMQKDF